MAAAHLLAASTSSSTAAAAFQPPLRLRSPTHPPPHLRLNRTGTYDAPSSLSAASTVRWGSKAKFDRSPDALLGASPPFAGRRPFPVVRAVETDATKDAKPKAPEKAAAAADGSSFNQLLGIKGATQETDFWKIRLQLTKPVTWPPLVWGVLCGAAASGYPKYQGNDRSD